MSDEAPGIGKVRFPDGTEDDVISVLCVARDEREVSIAKTRSGTIIIQTKSWLLENDRELVEYIWHFTPETFQVLYEAMVIGGNYIGHDFKAESQKIHASENGKIRIMYQGNGEPDLGNATEAAQ